VVRVVVDADGRRRADPRIVAAGLGALLSLHRSGDALAAWGHARAGEVELAPAAPSARTADGNALRFEMSHELTPG
jgi:hypothetical protein